MTNEEALEILKSIEILSFRDKKRKYFMADVWKAKKVAIKALEQTRPKGKWKPLNYKDEMWGYVYKCSNCGAIEYGGDYCPGCGADMEVEE